MLENDERLELLSKRHFTKKNFAYKKLCFKVEAFHLTSNPAQCRLIAG